MEVLPVRHDHLFFDLWHYINFKHFGDIGFKFGHHEFHFEAVGIFGSAGLVLASYDEQLVPLRGN